MLRKLLQNWRKSILIKYSVELMPRAYRNIEEIFAYIAYEKLSPENAKGQLDRIKKAIFRIDEVNRRVLVVTVQYQGRDL